ncbi:MAG TPA: preprotein translocase subunit SecG [Patescibacteria group bacterium]|nr:preprotein translocase subunit SecG [Patescibacteria group bacterium]
METISAVVLVIHLIVTLAIIITILIQPSEAGGFMGGGSQSNLMMQRRLGGDGLTRATTILAGIFFATSLFLAIAASHHPRGHSSILDVQTSDKAPLEKPESGAGDAKPADPDAPAPGEEKPELKEPGKTDPAVKEPQEDDKMGAPEQPKTEELKKPAKKTKK